MTKNLSAKYYQENKEKQSKKKSDNMVMNVTTLSEDEKQKPVE